MQKAILFLCLFQFSFTQILFSQFTSEKVLTIYGENSGDSFGPPPSSAGDINGDGVDDIILGANYNDSGGVDAGRAYIFWGSSTISGNISASNADIIITGENSGDFFGVISEAGDINGDGIDDVVIGGYNNDSGGSDAGRAYIFWGSTTRSGNLEASQADIIITGENSYDSFGVSVSTAGDLNGDGITDLVVGASRSDAVRSNAGCAYVFWGGTSFSGHLTADQADVIITGTDRDQYLGSIVSNAGDINGDGFDDLIIGAIGSGKVYLFWGGSSLSGHLDDNQANVIFTGSSSDTFGGSISPLGDVNQDGLDDLIIGAQMNDSGGLNAGCAYLFFGDSTLTGSIKPYWANVTFVGENKNDRFGFSASSAGDLTGDGKNDIVVGARFAGSNSNGRSYIFFGKDSFSEKIDASLADIILAGENSGDEFGLSVSTVGDVTDDGVDDLIIGAKRSNGNESGFAHIYHSIGLTLLSPNGGEFFSGNSVRTISWLPINLPSDHTNELLYSTDSGNTYPYMISNNVPGTGTYEWDVPIIDSDRIKVKIKAFDDMNNLLNEDSSDDNFIIDSRHPKSFSLLSPANGAWSNSTPTFIWQPSSDVMSGLQNYEIWIDGVVNQNNVPPHSTSVIPNIPLTSGVHTWNIKAKDNAGNVRNSNETWTIRVDGELPSQFNLLSPSDSLWSKDGRELFSWTPSSDSGSGLKYYLIHIGSDSIKIDANNTSYQNTKLLTSGGYKWYVTAVDVVGNKSNSSEHRTLFVDNTSPENFNLTSPKHNSWTRNNKPLFQWERSRDLDSGLGKYELFIDDIKIIENISPESNFVELDSTIALAEGSHSWYVNAVDIVGNVRQSTQINLLNVDLTPPESFQLFSPSDSTFSALPTPNFIWNKSSDKQSDLSHYSLWIDDILSVDNISDTISTPSLALTEGMHTWYVNAVDNVGNMRESSQRWHILTEWTAPNPFDLSFPENGSKSHSSLPAFGYQRTTDSGSGILGYQLWIDGVLNSNLVSPMDSLVIPINPLSSGIHNWFIKALDRAGNERVSSSTWQIIIDREGNLPPSIEAVSDQFAVEDSIYYTKFFASDANTADVLRFYDNSNLFEINKFSGEVSFIPQNEDVGMHKVTVYVTDGELSDSTTFNLSIKNTNDPPYPFKLIFPEHFAVIDNLNPRLLWYHSIDIDKSDIITYELYIDSLATFPNPLIFSNIYDSSFVVPYGIRKSNEYFWKVKAFDLTGSSVDCESFFKFITSAQATSVQSSTNEQLPISYNLLQNYPNPFNPTTTITFNLPKNTRVQLIIFNQMGQAIRQLTNQEYIAGTHHITWDANNEFGDQVSSGIYICKMLCDEYNGNIKMLFLK